MKFITMLLILCLLASSLACNPSNDGQAPSPVAPTFPSTAVLASPTEATATIAAPTPTPLPLPDFPDVLTFIPGAGGGGACEETTPRPDAISFVYASVGEAASFCIAIRPPTGGAIRLQLVSPSGAILDSPDIQYDPSTESVEWAGYPGFGAAALRVEDGTVYANLFIWWPLDWPPGQWRARVYGGESVATDVFTVTARAGGPFIMARDSRELSVLMPAIQLPPMHPLRANADSSVDVIGINYGPASPVFVLLYLLGIDDARGSLVQKLAVPGEPAEAVHARLPGPFQTGRTYVVFGLADPTAQWADGCGGYPCDMFRVVP